MRGKPVARMRAKLKRKTSERQHLRGVPPAPGARRRRTQGMRPAPAVPQKSSAAPTGATDMKSILAIAAAAAAVSFGASAASAQECQNGYFMLKDSIPISCGGGANGLGDINGNADEFRSAQARAPFLVAPSLVARRLLWCPLRAEPTHRAMPMRSPQPGRLLAAWWWKSHCHWIHRRRGGSCRCRRQRRPDPQLVDAVRRKPRRLPPGLLVPAGNAEPEFPGTLPVAGDNLEITILRLKAGVKPAFFVSSEPHAPLSKGLGRGAIYASWKSCNRPQILGRGKRAAG